MSLIKLIKHEHDENFKEEIDNIRMNKSRFKNKVTEMKNTLNGINCGLDKRIDHQYRRQSNGNHPIRSVKRKEHFKRRTV